MSDINLGDLPKYFPSITFEEINACERLKEYYWGTQRNNIDSICYGSATFLVAHEWMEHSWDNLNPFLKWLESEGFTSNNRNPGRIIGAAMLWINVNTKKYRCQKPGIGYCHPVFGHPFTPEEFKTIYKISKKYLDNNTEHTNL